jgi:hypothetical protein
VICPLINVTKPPRDLEKAIRVTTQPSYPSTTLALLIYNLKMSRRPKETKFGEEFQKEGKEVRSPHHVDTSTGGKAEIPEPQTKSDVERIAEGFLGMLSPRESSTNIDHAERSVCRPRG